MNKYKVTVFTPTYNREYIICNLYNSLKNQTINDFEWIVVDDGSTDNTELLFNKWIHDKDKSFPIKYIKTANRGKHRAINLGIDNAEGELFFIVDSDDYIVKNAIEKIIKWESTIRDSEQKFAGISGNKGYDKDNLIGATFSDDYIDATSLERNKYNIVGDKAEVFYTQILKMFKFPEFDGENFITENVVWNKIAYHGYKIRWFNQIIYIADYLEDGLTKSGEKLFINNPKGYALSIKQDIEYYGLSLNKRMKLWLYYYIQLREKLTINQMSKYLDIYSIKLHIIVFIWKLKNGIRQIF